MFCYPTTLLGRIKTRQCAKPRPLCRIGNREQIFRHSSEYLDAFLSLAPSSACSSSSSPYSRSLIHGTIRDTDPGRECLRSCWNFCDVGKRRSFRHQRMSCAPCRMSPLDEAEPPSCITPASRHVAIKEPVGSVQAFFAKGSNVRTHLRCVFACEEDASKTRLRNNTRAHRAAGRRYIFIGRSRRSIDSLQARRKDPGEGERETELRPRYPR